ncbi:hypothetical protein CUR65_01765 [Salmonella enterica subsp. enterica serovar Legon]|nr:hypothetical protein CUR58_05585 [Salmonella enterica subsp. enterica serovar Legon]PVB93474.1 hypothetical protein CUR65_01765 [Salmonella enterica subsp. enterica serovar Legon]PVB94700.1 hypothetical protein CUR66_04855 [Salmonella enterica subsp. enterica serovar Legon]PVC02153.1 hypothetical protein CUR73_05585 [Salmonella enterica subsp. enterica serovar Legon]PVC06838.1 hypothetical protein CUR74_11630 [Salmonella enterica subsp. enterica serovar Legon]
MRSLLSKVKQGSRPKASSLRSRRFWLAITRRRPFQITGTLAVVGDNGVRETIVFNMQKKCNRKINDSICVDFSKNESKLYRFTCDEERNYEQRYIFLLRRIRKG